MFSVFATSYRLRITYRVNSIIYSLKQLPLVRRLLPSALYRSRGLKRFACVIAILMEILGMFLQKGAYLGIVVLATEHTTYTACGLMYMAGIRGTNERTGAHA